MLILGNREGDVDSRQSRRWCWF